MVNEKPTANLRLGLRRLSAAPRWCGIILFLAVNPAAMAQEPPEAPSVVSDPPLEIHETNLAPERAFELAESEFRYQDYKKVVALLRPILYPTVSIGDPEKRRIAREYLATSYWWIKDNELAREEFTSLLVENPDHSLDPFYNPGPLIAFFDSLKAELQQQKLIESANDPPRIQPVRTAPTPSPWAVNLLPFGVPQFTYGNPARGWLFMIGQGMSLATSLASGLAIEDLRGSDGLFSSGDAQTARDIRIVWWTSSILMGTLYVSGVVDGFLNAPDLRMTPTRNIAEFEP